MKKLGFILAFGILTILPPDQVKADHIAGGEIFYEYIGDSTGIPYHYCVTIYVYRDNEGIPLPNNTMTVEVSSSCYASLSAPANQITDGANGPNGSYLIPSLNECADTGTVAKDRFVQHVYKTCLILPGPCADWVFGVEPPCCKNSAITNLADLGSSYYLAKLNNLRGENSSPVFQEPAAKVFCMKRLFNWSQRGWEPDGDSLYYDFGHPLDGPDPLVDTVPFASGHSKSQPMLTETGITIDHRSGVFTFIADSAKPQFAVVKVIIREYRFDSLTISWYQVGESMRELQIPIIAKCREDAENGPGIETGLDGFSETMLPEDYLLGLGIDSVGNPDPTFSDSLNQNMYTIPVVEGYTCYDSLVTLVFSHKASDTSIVNPRVQCSSIDPTDFRILGPDTVPRAVIGAYGTGCRDGGVDTDTIILSLQRPLDENGDYFLYTKRGNDGNTLLNICGFNLGEFFGMIIRVTDCPPLIYNIENVTVEDDQQIRVDWHIDSAYFAKGAWKVFTGWQLIRRKGGSSEGYYSVGDGLIKDINARSFTDTTLDDFSLDAESWDYAVQLYQNGYYKTPTNWVTSILLKDSLTTTQNLQLKWSPYIGWDGQEPWYQLYSGVADTNAGVAWEPIGPLDTAYYEYDHALPPADSLKKNWYAVKVEASGDSINGYTSTSNWIYFGTRPEPEILPNPVVGDPVFPNIFTPNSDGSNDVFYIRTVQVNEEAPLKPYPKIELAVYNRWGQLVFEDHNFAERNDPSQGWDGTDMNSGQKLADGVYYYTVTMTDLETWRKEQYRGSVSILSNGN